MKKLRLLFGDEKRIVALLISFFVAYSLYVLFSYYKASMFPYYDFGLINEFLSNAFFHGKSFFVSELNVNHLSVHFTPFLYLLAPFYKIIESPFIFIILNLAAYLIFTVFSLKIFYNFLETSEIKSVFLQKTLPIIFCLSILSNSYTKAILISAHYEIFYLATSMVLLEFLISNRRGVLLGAALLLCLSTRQDSGFFVSFSIFAVLFLPKRDKKRIEKLPQKVIGIISFSLLYVVVAVKLLMPLFLNGTKSLSLVQRYWGYWGESWGEVVKSLISSPIKVINEILNSGFFKFQKSFLFLVCLYPHVVILLTVLNILFFVSSDPYKKYLLFYNSSYCMPGMIVFFGLSLISVARFIESDKKKIGRKELVFKKVILFLLISMIPFSLARTTKLASDSGLRFFPYEQRHYYKDFLSLEERLNSAYAGRNLATDECLISFVPSSYKKSLYKNAIVADIIAIPESPCLTGLSPKEKTLKIKSLMEELESSGKFLREELKGGLIVYIKKK